MYVCMYVCMYVSISLSLSLYIYIYIYIYIAQPRLPGGVPQRRGRLPEETRM